jgi:ABC-type methionine transport system ATPase subunit
MAATKRQIYCTFPKEQIGEPILYTLGQKFHVVPNIRGATINENMGIVFLELEGEEADLEQAIAYLRERNVRVDTVQGRGG